MNEPKQGVNKFRKVGDSIKLIFRSLFTANSKMRTWIKLASLSIFTTIRKAGAKIKIGSILFWPVIRIVRVRMKQVLQQFFTVIRKIGIRIKQFFHKIYSAIRKTGFRKKLFFLLLFGVLLSAIWLKHLYTVYYGPNVVKGYMLFIHDEDNFDQVVKLLNENGCLTNETTFRKFARLKDYVSNIKPGAYRIQSGWNNDKLINVLKSGAQTPVMVTFNSIRTREDLAGKLSRQLQSDSLAFLTAFRNDSNATRNGFKPETFPALFVPNTYSFYWTTTPSGFLTRMKREYDLFWNEARKLQAKTIGLTTEQVATLASIVQEESNKNDEKPVIAGVYLNRLHKNWPLQADPTIRFALGDFAIRRILTDQLTIDSPYNTYKNAGLPPGPINFPEISSIDAVLNTRVHDYFYFCAKEDFSGYHNFAKTLTEHNKNARKYQAALNKMKIYK